MSSYWLSTEQFSVSLQGMSMGDKEQLREIERGRNIENGTLLISQLKYECADIIDKLFVVDHVIWTIWSWFSPTSCLEHIWQKKFDNLQWMSGSVHIEILEPTMELLGLYQCMQMYLFNYWWSIDLSAGLDWTLDNARCTKDCLN